MSDPNVSLADPEKRGKNDGIDPINGDSNDVVTVDDQGKLHRNLQGRHMQMIAM
jgi:amino acid permease